MGKKKIVVDSDFLVALYRQDDASHERATKLFGKVGQDEPELVIINLVIQETATVLSHRIGAAAARKFYEQIRSLADIVIFVDEQLEEQSWQVFLKQSKKGTSFVDCANLAAIAFYNLEGILSFDTFYPRKLRLS